MQWRGLVFSPEETKRFFFLGQLGVGALVLALWYWTRGKAPESGFRADQPRHSRSPSARSEKKKQLLLEGLRLDGAPHEILGVSAKATPKEIQKAYRDLMKRYHPDRVGRPGTREWQDAQKIAEALNRAKDTLLK